MRFSFLLGTALIFVVACKAKQNGSATLEAGMQLEQSGDSLIGLTYSDQNGNSLVFADATNLAISGPGGEDGFYATYKFEREANRVVLTFPDGALELYLSDQLKQITIPGADARLPIEFVLKSSADERKGELLQVASVPLEETNVEGLALGSGSWCIWVKRPDLFGPDMRPGCIRDIEQALSGVRCQVAAVKTSPRLLCNARYDARTFKRISCVESVHEDRSSAGCFISSQTPVDNAPARTDSLDDINRRLEALLARLEAMNGTSGGGNGGGNGNSGNNNGGNVRVTKADVVKAARAARAKYNVDQSTRSGCEAAGAAANWTQTMQEYYCEFPINNPNIRECFTGSVRGTSPYTKKSYPEAYQYCHSSGLRGERPMQWIRDNQDAVFRAVMIDKQF
jgi:hypothetical protein